MPVGAYAPSRRTLVLILGSTLALTALTAGTFAYVQRPYIQAVNDHNGAGKSSVKAASVSGAPVMREVSIANNGLVLVRSARVESVSGNTSMIVDISWGSMTLPWKVMLASSKGGTHFIRPDGEAGSLDDISTGDTLTITGMLDTGDETPTVDAQYVREQ